MSRRSLQWLATVLWLGAGPVPSHVETQPITLPAVPGGNAIWGASGADASGHIWLGVSTGSAAHGSAHLIEYDPTSKTSTDRGNVLDELKRLRLFRIGETQMQIRSRIVQVGDYLYFASMDERGGAHDGSRPPTSGGHLWRIRLPDRRWEHLLRTPEALIAVAASDRDVYALGYFDHVLYQYDVITGKTASREVGSQGAHVSRNLFVDGRGNVHVPRLDLFEKETVSASLVEFDASLREIATPRMDHYLEADVNSSRGIVAFQPVGDMDVVFATGAGRLYRLAVQPRGDSRLEDLGSYDASSSRAVETMFLDGGGQKVWGLARSVGRKGMDLILRSLTEASSSQLPVPYGGRLSIPDHPQLYGSVTRDQAGWAYVTGSLDDRPLALRVKVSLH